MPSPERQLRARLRRMEHTARQCLELLAKKSFRKQGRKKRPRCKVADCKGIASNRNSGYCKSHRGQP